MNILKRASVARGARADAQSGENSVEERIVAELGVRPRLDPAGNAEHATFVSALQSGASIEELREDITRLEDAAAHHRPTFLLTLGLVLAVAVEVVGALLIMKAVGVEPNERLPLGLALALALIGLTAVTSHRASPRTAGKEQEGIAAVAKRSLISAIVLVTYSIFVVAVAVLRVHAPGEEDASHVDAIASAVIMLATSLGPAWAVEWLLRLRAPAVVLEKRLATLRRRLRDVERATERARKAVNEIARAGARWDDEAARRRALYATEHRLELARGGNRK